jgi:hypothetical protein
LILNARNIANLTIPGHGKAIASSEAELDQHVCCKVIEGHLVTVLFGIRLARDPGKTPSLVECFEDSFVWSWNPKPYELKDKDIPAQIYWVVSPEETEERLLQVGVAARYILFVNPQSVYIECSIECVHTLGNYHSFTEKTSSGQNENCSLKYA